MAIGPKESQDKYRATIGAAAVRRAWNKANPNAQRATKLGLRFGLTIAQFDAMVVAQHGVCAICFGENINGRRLCVDHDHVTGLVRGLLCTPCNSALGMVKDNPAVLLSAVDYLGRKK